MVRSTSSCLRSLTTFNPANSWLLGEAQAPGLAFATIVTAAFAVAAAGFAIRAAWWEEATLIAAVLSLVLLLLFFNVWWTAGYLISLTLAVVAWRLQAT
jgi:hypothetical protein